MLPCRRRYFSARHYFWRTVVFFLLVFCSFRLVLAASAPSAGPSTRSCARLAGLTAGVATDEAPTAQNRARRPQQGTRRAQKHPRQHERALKFIFSGCNAPRDPWQLVCQGLGKRVARNRPRCHQCDSANKVKGHGASRGYSKHAQRKRARLAS